MSYTTDQWRKAIANLIKKTSKKEVEWQAGDEYDVDVWTEVDRSLSCVLGDFVYVVSQTRRKHYLDEDVWVWDAGYHFSVRKADSDRTFIASAPQDLSAIGDLFHIAEQSYAFSEGALGGLLD